MLWVKLGTHITDHERFLSVGALARDLWSWGMLYAGKHETDGELPMAAVLTSAWGHGTQRNVHLAITLVEAGLWLRTTHGFSICRWAEQGNETKASIIAKREAGKERKARFDAAKVTRSECVRNGVGNAFGSTSTSSESLISDPDPTRDPPSEVRMLAAPESAGPPDWFGTAVEVIAMGTGVELPVSEAWLRYDGHRAGKGIAPTPKDAQYWLTTVMVPEARELLRRAARDRERDAAFRRDKLGTAPKPENSRKQFQAHDDWQREAGPPDPETQARMRKLLGGVGR